MRSVWISCLVVLSACAGPLTPQNLVTEDARSADSRATSQDAYTASTDVAVVSDASVDVAMQPDVQQADMHDAGPTIVDNGPADTGPAPDVDIGCSGRYPDRCGGSCTDFLTNRFNCGGCGIRCEDAANCINGTCVRPCPVGQVLCGNTECIQESRIQNYRNCGGRCVEVLGSDPNNCGACNSICVTSNGYRCVYGQCSR
jgi:hypothetical protein